MIYPRQSECMAMFYGRVGWTALLTRLTVAVQAFMHRIMLESGGFIPRPPRSAART